MLPHVGALIGSRYRRIQAAAREGNVVAMGAGLGPGTAARQSLTYAPGPAGAITKNLSPMSPEHRARLQRRLSLGRSVQSQWARRPQDPGPAP
jgi:hypothetical protein